MITLREIGFSGLIVILLLFFGCSASQDVDATKRNLRQQLAVQRQLQRLNRQNEKLKQTLRESSVINIETGEVLDNNFVTKNHIPEINRLLQQFKQVNLDTQLALKSLEQTIQNDSDKNLYVDQMLDGFASACEQQEDRLSQIQEGLNQRTISVQTGDNVHIGISGQAMSGSAKLSSSELNLDENLNYSGASGSAYFNYVGDVGAIGLKYMVLSGRIEPKEKTDNGAYNLYNAQVGMLGIGFKITSVQVFNIVPQILYGTGESKVFACNEKQCATDSYWKARINAVGLEIPFYRQLSSAFSWGFKFSAYQFSSGKFDVVVNDEAQGDLPAKLEITSSAVGLMIGAAW